MRASLTHRVQGNHMPSSIQDEGHFQVHPIHGHLVILDDDMLFLDPRAFDIVYGLGSLGDAILNGNSSAIHS